MKRRQFLRSAVGSTAVGGAVVGATVGTAGCLGGAPGRLAPSSDEAVSADGAWNQPAGGPGHAHAADGPGPGDAVESRWRYTGEGDESVRPRAVVDETVFATDDGTVVALDARDGEEQWRASVGTSEPESLAVGPENVYLPDGWFPRDPPSGVSLSAYPGASEPVRELTLVEDVRCYAAGTRVIATDSGAENPRWVVDIDVERPLDLGGIVAAGGPDGPVATGGTGGTVAAVTDTAVIGLGLSDGRRRWRYDDDLSDASHLHVAGQSGRFYVAPNPEGPVRAIHAATGAEAWRYDHGFPAYVAATAERVVLGGTPRQGLKHRVEVLDADGNQQWTTPEERNDSNYDPPVVADGTVYASHVAGVFAYDLASGDERWSLSAGRLQSLLGGGLYPIGDLVVAGSGLFLAQDGDVYGLGPG